jgi:prolyl-tRNA synthetase
MIKNEAITKSGDDFAKWYTDVVKKAELADYSDVRGCIIFRPYGYAIWELIQQAYDKRFKETGHENVYMPMFIPESLLQKESEHVEGFAPEVAWVTLGGSEELQERLAIRPTSETLFCEHYKKIIQSHRDLPKLYNQWCSVVRWEKTTRPFLRTSEFLWQEGHTAHATEAEAREETLRILDIYAEVAADVLAIPTIKGRKTDKEKFAGAEETYSIESVMRDGKALQSGTTHYFGNNFSKAFDITYTNKDNKLEHVYQTSWGLSTRLIGALIMVHGDDNGLVLPPGAAPTEVAIIPVASHKPGVMEKSVEIKKILSGRRVKIDDSDKSPGWKFSEAEMKGIPIRIEIGPKDLEKNQAVLVRRDTGEKIYAPLSDIKNVVNKTLDQIQSDMLEAAKRNLYGTISQAFNLKELEDNLINKPGFIKGMWCGDRACEDKIKELFAATSRNMPIGETAIGDKCVCCGRPANKLVYWGKAY